MRSGEAQNVAVDMRHAVVECRSERYLRVDGKPPPPAWDAIAGVYKTGDGRFVRLHTNFPHHRAAVCTGARLQGRARRRAGGADEMGGGSLRDRGLCRRRRGRDDALIRRMVRNAACASAGPASVDQRSRRSAKPRQSHGRKGDRPLAGIRVLDLSRVIAGPVAGRTLAAHGADVMLISGPGFAGDPVALHRQRPRQALELHRAEERRGPRHHARAAAQRLTSSRKAIGRARSPRSALRPRMLRASIPASSM